MGSILLIINFSLYRLEFIFVFFVSPEGPGFWVDALGTTKVLSGKISLVGFVHFSPQASAEGSCCG